MPPSLLSGNMLTMAAVREKNLINIVQRTLYVKIDLDKNIDNNLKVLQVTLSEKVTKKCTVQLEDF